MKVFKQHSCLARPRRGGRATPEGDGFAHFIEYFVKLFRDINSGIQCRQNYLGNILPVVRWFVILTLFVPRRLKCQNVIIAGWFGDQWCWINKEQDYDM
jgi:hypothetical protein